MSFHPNDVVRRGRVAAIAVCGVLVFLLSAFFKTQIIGNQKWTLQSEENRLREVPLPAPRGIIFDRSNRPIADNVVGYSVALLSQNEDTLRATMTRLRSTIDLPPRQFENAIRRYRKDPSRPTVIFPDASFDVVSVLEEHRMDFPSLIIQSSPKRVYPTGQAVGAFSGYISEINEGELTSLGSEGYKPGQQIGKQGLEKQYEAELRGREGVQFIEVDSRNRPVPLSTMPRPQRRGQPGGKAGSAKNASSVARPVRRKCKLGGKGQPGEGLMPHAGHCGRTPRVRREHVSLSVGRPAYWALVQLHRRRYLWAFHADARFQCYAADWLRRLWSTR